jgi:hypothetical protein
MAAYDGQVPGLLPILARGKHRKPSKGACFMELASLLAGERWSDHPACTHPLLSRIARDVNDWTSDAGRHRLGVLIPSVIGLRSDDLHVDARVALRCATLALPVVSAQRQRVMAVSMLACERALADLDGRPPASVQDQIRAALAEAPDAARWADAFTRRLPFSPTAFRRQSAPSICHFAVVGIARACIPDPDAKLRDLLAGAIAECAASIRSHDEPARTSEPGAETLDVEALLTACRVAGVQVRS